MRAWIPPPTGGSRGMEVKHVMVLESGLEAFFGVKTGMAHFSLGVFTLPYFNRS